MTINNKEIKVLGFIAAHYGVEYAYACIKALDTVCDKIVVIYSEQGSQGHRTTIPCPDSEADLRAEMERASNKIQWVKGTFAREADHRNEVLNYASGFDIICVADTDEIWEPADLPKAIEYAMESKARHINVKGFINFWKSFNHVCYDGFLPYRLLNLHNDTGTDTVEARIYHFGTCQRDELVKYKWEVSGHRSEVKAGWYENVYKAWNAEENQQDLHVVSIGLWNAVPFDKTQLPDILKQHPNYGKDVVE